jgi:hypothetical protein
MSAYHGRNPPQRAVEHRFGGAMAIPPLLAKQPEGACREDNQGG